VWTLAGSESATLLQLDPATGAVKSRTVIGATNHFCTPSAAAGRIYVPAGNSILALAPAA
jgi:outer membrane protein assembly factor BamB